MLHLFPVRQQIFTHAAGIVQTQHQVILIYVGCLRGADEAGCVNGGYAVTLAQPW
jgi:hypothetical protein